jgi:predicted nucleic acid-binding protein
VSDHPRIIVDSNVALDLLVFGDPSCEPLRRALAAGRLRWLASAAMRDELSHVLVRGFGPRWPLEPWQVLDRWDRLTEHAQAPLACALPCTDADDQKFIDLAVACGPSWLLTRDRALLRLARQARSHGVSVRPPGAWLASGLDAGTSLG